MKFESIVSFYDRESLAGTEFRRLYSNIKKFNGSELKSVMVTSSTIEEGKSTISCFLALAIAESRGDRVLLLDTDLRRPMINVYYKLQLETGFADILDKKCSVKEAIKSTTIPGLKIITAGKLSKDPSLALKPSRLREVFEELRFYFDFIVVDVPPVVPVSDPVLIASEVDGTLLVVKAGVTPREVVKRAVNFLQNSKINILGVVLNNLDDVLPYYYSHKYHAYGYYNKTADLSKK